MRIIHKRKLAVTVVLFLATLFIAALIGSLAVLGGGYVLKAVLPIGLFEASVIFIATIFTMAVSVGLADIKNVIRVGGEDWEDESDWDEDEPDEESENLTRSEAPQAKSISRNQPCPCGSGRKYKNCCLDRSEDQDAIPF